MTRALKGEIVIEESQAAAILATRLAGLRPLCQEQLEHWWLDVLSGDVAVYLWQWTTRRRRTQKGRTVPPAPRALLAPPIDHPRSGRFALKLLFPADIETGKQLEAVADVLSGTFFVLRAAEALPTPLLSADRARLLIDVLAEHTVDADVQVRWARRVLACDALSASQPRTRQRTDARAKFVVCEVSRLCQLRFGAPMHSVATAIATKLGLTAGASGALTREVSRSVHRRAKGVALGARASPEQ